VTATDDIASYEREPETFDDPTVTGFESVAAAQAFAALPERWQAVLWHTEVEGEKPAQVAPLLGLTPNGVSALAYRAREGLRQAYLQQHLADVANDRCRWATERLGAYVRGGLTKRENTNMREHLDECPRCTAVYLELVEVNSSLPALLAPALLGVAGLGYLSAAGVKVGGAGLLGSLWHRATEHGGRTTMIAAGGVVVVVAAVVAALALSGGEKPVGGAPQDVIQSSQRPSTGQPPPSQVTKPPSTQPTQPTQPTQSAQPTQVPTSGPTSVPTSAATSGPTAPPSRSAPAPRLDEGLLTIDTATAGSRGRSATVVAAATASTRRRLTVRPEPGTTKVTVEISYGARLNWPVAGNPPGWTCTPNPATRSGLCTAARATSLERLTIEYDTPNGGASRTRTFTATARTYVGNATTPRFFDDDSAKVQPAGRNDDIMVVTGSGGARTVTVNPLDDNVFPVVIQFGFGRSLRWPVSGSPAGWTCNRANLTCTAANREHPAPLRLGFASPDGGSAADRTFTLTARIGQLYAIYTRTLGAVFDSENLLRIDKSQSGLRNYKVDFVVSPPANHTGTVALGIRYGQALSLTFRSTRDWSCQSSTGAVRCTSTVSRPIPLRAIAHVGDLRPQADGWLVATASAGQVSDADAYSDIRGMRTTSRQPLSARLTETLQALRRGRTRHRVGA
jgi:hypothetical protein